MKGSQRFKGLTLAATDRKELRRRAGAGKKWTARVWRRMQSLQMLDRGMTLTATAAALGTFRREVSRVASRYVAKGLEHALSEEPRPEKQTKLDSTQQAALVALACGPPPEGDSRWTLRSLTKHAVQRGVTDSIGKETIRVILAEHKLKPWREKMWCVPELNEEYIERMEDVLQLYARPFNWKEPVIGLDERPVKLLDSERPGIAMRPGKPVRRDYEYVRRGTANIFCVVAPHTGDRMTRATRNRTGASYARMLARIEKRFAYARTIHLVQDNLSTHTERSLIATFGRRDGRKLWRRFTVHSTPKHGSWLNVAEIEASLASRECLGKRRIGELRALRREVTAWRKRASGHRRTIDWKFRVNDARCVFRYDGIKSRRPRH